MPGARLQGRQKNHDILASWIYSPHPVAQPSARLRRSRQRVRAREELREAIDLFDQVGAGPWAEQASVELAATGETARRRDASTLDALTPQELQIALLLGAGRTTREAAASLFLSPKTIEYHLRSIYRKLGVNSRAALAAALAAREST